MNGIELIAEKMTKKTKSNFFISILQFLKHQHNSNL